MSKTISLTHKLLIMIKKAIILATILLVFSSCASYRTFYTPQVDSASGQQKLHLHGAESVTTKQPNARITLQLQKVHNREVNLLLSVVNDSETSFTFDPTQISATGYNNVGAGQSLKVMTPKQLAKRKARSQALTTGLLVATGTLAIATAANNANYYPYGYDPLFWTWFLLLDDSNTPPPTPPMVFKSPDGIIRTHTLRPGEELQGIVKIKCRNGFTEKVKLHVPVHGSDAKFEFSGEHRVY